MAQVKEYPDKLTKPLLSILAKIEEEDMYIRQRMLREAKQLELYWHGFQFVFWDERVQDFRIPTHDIMEQVSTREEVKFIYDYVINVFKAHGLSIISAMSSEIPGVFFAPYDSDNPKDILAAKRAETLGKIIAKKNKSKLIFYHALFTLFTNHFVACYNYFERDKKWGQTQLPDFKTEKGPDIASCSACQFNTQTPPDDEKCPTCGNKLDVKEGENQVTQVGTKTENLGMEKLLIKGTLNVKIPTYAADQDSCGYLIDYSDQHYTYLRKLYKDTIPRDKLSLMGTDNFERIARMPSIGRLYSDTYLQSLLSLKRVWLRPYMFEMLEEEESDYITKKYPDGVCFHVVDAASPIVGYIYGENLDDHWTIAKADLSRAVHGDPMGKPILPMQDIENMVGNLLIESLEHSVPSTYADTEIIDFDLYSHQEVTPGAVYPTKTPLQPNRKLDDYFYTLKTSTLPKEGVDYQTILDGKTQFLVGSFPSIFGGPQSEGSKTLGEYQESRNYALQRLSIPYQMLYFWWADVEFKSVIDYIDHMVSDEKHSIQNSQGKFGTINILKDDFSDGRFQQLLPESSTDLPVSFSQKRSLITQIITLNNETINEFLFSPENRRTTLKYFGMEDFDDLDSNQSLKQLLEIEEMITSPVPVPIEPEIDDDEIHLRVLKTLMCSDLGQDYKKNKPDVYSAWMQHAQQHYQNLQQTQMQQAQLNNPPNKQFNQPNQLNQPSPIVKPPLPVSSNGQ